MRTAVLAVALAATTAACRSAPRTPPPPAPVATVSDADLGRLAPEQMGPVQAGRAALGEARDAVARAQLRLQDSRHEEGWANAERAQAEGDRLRAAAELSAAREAGTRGRRRSRPSAPTRRPFAPRRRTPGSSTGGASSPRARRR